MRTRKTNAERILELLRSVGEPLDDDEIAERLGIRPRQQVNQICNRLAAEGAIERVSLARPGKRRKIHNRIGQRPETVERMDAPAHHARWRRTLRLLEAATGMDADTILDRALAAYARRLLDEELGGSSDEEATRSGSP